MEWFTRRMIGTIVLALIAVAAAVAIWEAIPGIVKVLAIAGAVFGFLGIMKN